MLHPETQGGGCDKVCCLVNDPRMVGLPQLSPPAQHIGCKSPVHSELRHVHCNKNHMSWPHNADACRSTLASGQLLNSTRLWSLFMKVFSSHHARTELIDHQVPCSVSPSRFLQKKLNRQGPHQPSLHWSLVCSSHAYSLEQSAISYLYNQTSFKWLLKAWLCNQFTLAILHFVNDLMYIINHIAVVVVLVVVVAVVAVAAVAAAAAAAAV